MFTFREQPDGRFRVTDVEVVPTYVDGRRGLRVVDVSTGALPAGIDVGRAQRARARTPAMVLRRGAGQAGAVVRRPGAGPPVRHVAQALFSPHGR